jgi:hypothetical protein
LRDCQPSLAGRKNGVRYHPAGRFALKMPTTELAVLFGALVVLMLPLIALELYSDHFPKVQQYKGWISIGLWIGVLALIYFVIVPWLELA